MGSEDEESSLLGDGIDWHLDVDYDMVTLAAVELHLSHHLFVGIVDVVVLGLTPLPAAVHIY